MSGLTRLPRRGFTLVELLIVIVVIGILAAITLVAYNGIQQRATNASMMADVSSIVKFIEMYHAEYGILPPAAASNTYCLTADNDCTLYNGAKVTANNTALISQLSQYGTVPQSVPSLSSSLHGIYISTPSPSTPFVYNGGTTPTLVVFWLQGANQNCSGISGMTSVSGNGNSSSPFVPGTASNPATNGGTMTRCYEVFADY